MFPNKNWSLGGMVDWKCWSKKLTTHVVYCCLMHWVVADLALSAQYLCCQFFWSALSVHQDSSFC